MKLHYQLEKNQPTLSDSDLLPPTKKSPKRKRKPAAAKKTTVAAQKKKAASSPKKKVATTGSFAQEPRQKVEARAKRIAAIDAIQHRKDRRKSAAKQLKADARKAASAAKKTFRFSVKAGKRVNKALMKTDGFAKRILSSFKL